MDLDVVLRSVDSADQPFLFDLFRAVRAARFEFQPGGHPQMDVVVRLQFEASEKALAARHEGIASHSLILAGHQPVGRVFIARSETALHLADISLLPAQQRQGIGTFVVQSILSEARDAQLPVRCTVQQNNPGGYSFLRSLGFKLVAQDTAYAHLQWQPTTFL